MKKKEPDPSAMPVLQPAVTVEDARWKRVFIESVEDVLQRLWRQFIACNAVINVPDNAIADISLLLTDDKTIQGLNQQYRDQDKPTNVLSFPQDNAIPAPGHHVMLGDVVLAYETIAREAVEQHKAHADHATHMLLHGMLHLLGYDHEADDEAEEMEALETRILMACGMADPYADFIPVLTKKTEDHDEFAWPNLIWRVCSVWHFFSKK